jgi:hypothetical protein
MPLDKAKVESFNARSFLLSANEEQKLTFKLVSKEAGGYSS